MTLHIPTDIARTAQINWDNRCPADTEIEFQDACNAVATDYDRHGDTAELIAVVVCAERALDHLISSAEVPAHLLPSLRELLEKQARLCLQIEREMKKEAA